MRIHYSKLLSHYEVLITYTYISIRAVVKEKFYIISKNN